MSLPRQRTESRHVVDTVLGKMDLWQVVASKLRLTAGKIDAQKCNDQRLWTVLGHLLFNLLEININCLNYVTVANYSLLLLATSRIQRRTILKRQQLLPLVKNAISNSVSTLQLF